MAIPAHGRCRRVRVSMMALGRGVHGLCPTGCACRSTPPHKSQGETPMRRTPNAARRRWAGVAVAALLIASVSAAVSMHPAAADPPPGVGATVPFTSYEGEAGAVSGGATVVSLTAAPTTQYSSAAL